MDFTQRLRDYDAIDSIEFALKESLLRFLETHGEDSFGREIAGETGHITGAAWITNRAGTKVLLVFGSKLGQWKLPGEHVQSQEQLREVTRLQAARALGNNDFECDKELFALAEVEIPSYWNTPDHRHFEVVVHVVAEERSALPKGAKWFGLQEAAALGDRTLAGLVSKWLNRVAKTPVY